jgi:hypothetical protein
MRDVDSKESFVSPLTILLLLVLAFAAYAYSEGWLRF